jgi:hypothetical protein
VCLVVWVKTKMCLSRLRATAWLPGKFEQPEQTIFMAVSRWERCLAAWGDDSIGAQFAKYYVKGQSDVVKGLHDMMDGVAGIVNDLNAMAYNYEKAEESNSR